MKWLSFRMTIVIIISVTIPVHVKSDVVSEGGRSNHIHQFINIFHVGMYLEAKVGQGYI